MVNLDLQPNESIIIKSSNVYHGDGVFAQYTDDLILTNFSIILVHKGPYGTGKKTNIYPINQIKVFNRKAQVILSRSRSLIPQIEIYFRDGQEVFGFMSKKEAIKWIDNINILRTGNEADQESKQLSGIPGTELVTSVLSDTFGAVKDVVGSITKNNHKSAEVKVNNKCISCGAPLTGIRGQSIRCKYCDTNQSL